MNRHFAATMSILMLISSASAINYMYLSDTEETVFGDHIRWWGQDTLSAPIRTNGCFYFMQNPVISAPVLMGSDTCSDCDFHGPWGDIDVTCGAPPYPFPEHADWLRQVAETGGGGEPGYAWFGHFLNHGGQDQALVKITPNHLRIWWGMAGEPVDTVEAEYEEAWLDEPWIHVCYFDCPIEISGRVDRRLIVASSGTIGIADNIVYASSTMPNGIPAPGHDERFALVAEGDIKILNTPENGRNNSNFQGPNQTNPDLTDVALNGFFVALGESFTFENQNLADSSYVCIECGCTPVQGGSPNPNCGVGGLDERGTIWLWGGLAQKRRGYVHRSCCNGTGYDKQYRWDPELADFDFGVFNHEANRFNPDSLNFGDVVVGDTLWDTLHADNYRVPVALAMALANPPFYTPPLTYQTGQHFLIPVRFIPSHVGVFTGSLVLNVASNTYQIPVTGRGVAGAGPPIIEPTLYPNPFNNTATLTFVIENSGMVRLELYDVLGRRVTTFLDGYQEAGPQRVLIDGTDLASGVYFARLNTATRNMTIKLLLLK